MMITRKESSVPYKKPRPRQAMSAKRLFVLYKFLPEASRDEFVLALVAKRRDEISLLILKERQEASNGIPKP